ncbi:glycosyltransferase [Flavobacterium sp. NST-5]|uniref:Glycosyltransferase n=1 Tax=Flavobacterium ichthyis TaxID=2698827 RepID=A0ABW9Z469_9FLAO|nr:glycosyltransferase [Flavobacterium ichthyis]NBL63638.1 glycosyltransferase [Flavobacterium ichthyis]
MKQKLLIIGSVFPEPNSSAAGTRMMQLINLFNNNNFEIIFASTAQKSEFSENLSELNVSEKNILLNDDSFDDFLKDLHPHIVLFDRFAVEEQFGWRVSKNCPEALKILDTEDLHFLRHARQKMVKANEKFSMEVVFDEDITKREIASIFRCDLTLIVSKFEMNLLQNHFKIDDFQLLYLPVFSKTSEVYSLCFEDRNGFMFIGNFLHEPNYDAVLELKKNIWPMIKKALPEARIHIYGAYPSQKVFQLHNAQENFLIEGRAEDVQNAMNQHRVLLAPIRFGAGIKGKFIDAMQFGLPTITTSIGAEGMNFGDWNGFVEDDFTKFAAQAIYLYQNKITWDEAQCKGFLLLKNFEAENFVAFFWQKIETWQLNLSKYRKRNFIGEMLNFHTMRSTEFMSRWIQEKNKK